MSTKMIGVAIGLSAGWQVACSVRHDAPATPDAVATVRAFEEAVGAAGRIAVFQDGAGVPLVTRVTGADGTARGPVTAGDMVTIANVGSMVFDLTTYVDVVPGDDLLIGEPEPEDDFRDIGTVPVSIPPPIVGATRYDVGLGLSQIDYRAGGSTLHLTDRQLAADGSFQILAVARDPSGAPIAFALASSTEATSGGVNSLAAWRTDWQPVAVSITGLPSDARVTARLDVLQGESGRFRGDEVSPTSASQFGLITPRSLGNELECELEIAEPGGERLVIQRQPRTSNIAIDSEQALLPRVTRLAVSASEDPARPTVTWSIDGDAGRADFVMVRMRWGGGGHQWTAILPPSHEQRFQFPALPPELAQWRPGAGAEVAVGLIELSAIRDYRAVLRRGVEELEDLESGQRLTVSSVGVLGL